MSKLREIILEPLIPEAERITEEAIRTGQFDEQEIMALCAKMLFKAQEIQIGVWSKFDTFVEAAGEVEKIFRKDGIEAMWEKMEETNFLRKTNDAIRAISESISLARYSSYQDLKTIVKKFENQSS